MGVLLLTNLAGCTRTEDQLPNPPRDPPASTNPPPIYPNAEQVHSEGEPRYRTITFQTSDKPEDVIAFYKKVMLKDGWRIYPTFAPAEPNKVLIEWRGGEHGPYYTLNIAITPTLQMKSDVELRYIKAPMF